MRQWHVWKSTLIPQYGQVQITSARYNARQISSCSRFIDRVVLCFRTHVFVGTLIPWEDQAQRIVHICAREHVGSRKRVASNETREELSTLYVRPANYGQNTSPRRDAARSDRERHHVNRQPTVEGTWRPRTSRRV